MGLKLKDFWKSFRTQRGGAEAFLNPQGAAERSFVCGKGAMGWG